MNPGFLWLGILATCLACSQRKQLKLLGNIEAPQRDIAITIARIINQAKRDSVTLIEGSYGSLANIDSLENHTADFGIVDNYSKYSDKVTAIMPLYPQILHILHKKDLKPTSIRSLLLSGKVFSGIEGSGTRMFVDELISDSGLTKEQVAFTDIINFFEADVIFSFTDILSDQDLRDLKEYSFFSLDQIDDLGKGSSAEGICTRHPQFQPYIIPKQLYGEFTREAVLTIKVDALLVCRSDLEKETVYSMVDALMENRQQFMNINPLLFNISSDFDPYKLNFTTHPGSVAFLQRQEPSFVEKYADVMSVIISVFVALASGLFTLSQWQKTKKKNEIDNFLEQLARLRSQIATSSTEEELNSLDAALNSLQDETLELVVDEKLLANESFLIFLSISRTVAEKIKEKRSKLGLLPPLQA